MRGVARLAPHAGWQVEAVERIAGKMHQWPTDTLLHRATRTAAVRIWRERVAETVMQSIVGFLHDVPNAGLVLALPPNVANNVEGAREFEKRVIAIPLAKGAAKRIVQAAERAAS